MPRDRGANLRFNPKTKRWDYNVRLVRGDGSVFRRAGSGADESSARRKRDAHYAEFNRDEGAAKDSRKRARRERMDTLSGWFERCVDDLWKHELADTSRDAYFYCIRKHVLPARHSPPRSRDRAQLWTGELGEKALAEITVPVLQQVVNDLWESGDRSAARQVRSSMSALFATAVRHGGAAVNPAIGVQIRDERRREVRDEVSIELRRLLSEDEVLSLIAASEGTCMHLPILLGARMGLRIGEALGLEARHVDLRNGVLHVRQQLQWVRGQGNKPVPPKSRSSRRTLPIPGSVLPVLERAIALLNPGAGPFLVKKDGGAMPAKKHSLYMRQTCEMAGLTEPYPTHHNLRGTYLSYLANVKRALPHQLMAVAGHGSIEVTMRYYVQASDGDLRDLVADL